MRFLLFISAFFFGQICFAQTSPPHWKTDSSFLRADEEEFCCVLEIDAGTDVKKWQTYLADNLELDTLALDTIPPGSYTVRVQFVVDTAGKITNVKAENDPGYGLAGKAVKVIAAYPDYWTPAGKNGRKIKSYHTQPIIFILEEEEECEGGEETILRL